MAQADVSTVDSVICREIISVVSCTFDELIRRLPAYSWAQVFSAVDRLSRQGTLTQPHALFRLRGIHWAGTSHSPVFPRPEVPSVVRSNKLIAQ